MRRVIIAINKKYSVIMFDLGGVVIDCSRFTKMLDWQDWTRDPQELLKKFDESVTFHKYQNGDIGTKEFVETTINELDLTVNVSRFIREFRIIPKDFYDGAEELLRQLGKSYTTACFSNTNEVHWNKMCGVNNVDKAFKKTYLSHQIHMSKPDKAAFEYVTRKLGVPPDEIVFFDDRSENVDAAKEAGLNAFLTIGFEALTAKIAELELL